MRWNFAVHTSNTDYIHTCAVCLCIAATIINILLSRSEHQRVKRGQWELLLQAGTAVASRHCCCKQALLLQAGTAVASRHCCCKQALLLQAGTAVASRHCCCKQALLLQAGTAVASRHCCCKQALLLQAGTAVASRHCCCKQALLLCRHDYLTALLATYCLAVALSIVRCLANNGRLSLHRYFLHGRRVIQHL